MSFKDFAAADIRGTFINLEEFGEKHNIDGDDLTVVVDNDIINDRPRLFAPGSEDQMVEGVFRNKITFFVAAAELGYRPVENELMRFDGKPCIVRSVNDSAGVYEVTLEANGL